MIQTIAQDGRQILGDLVHYRTYAAVKEDGRKENRGEVISRVREMHQRRFPDLAEEIAKAFEEVDEGRVVPSMRTMQFGGSPVEKSNARSYNCAFAALTTWKDFSDLFWLLMNGVGVGYSVQSHHVNQLPKIRKPSYHRSVYDVPDSSEGWADGLAVLLENPFVMFDTSQVRPKGAPLSTGGTASGPESLVEMYEKVRVVLLNALDRKLSPLECFDIMCHVSDLVVVGGVRRAATIALFDADDEEMLTSKHGKWWKTNSQRARANISAVLVRDDPDFEPKLRNILDKCFESHCGEPGISLTNDRDWGFNPCHEIALRDGQLCNLTEINAAACQTEAQFLRACKSAAVIGTLQASYTDFDYLAPKWKKNCEEEALLGISMTGQAQNWELLTEELCDRGERFARAMNERWSKLIGINRAARLTTTKPSGNTSAWWGTSSGIHAAHSPFFLRRMRVDRKDAFGKYLIWLYGEAEAESNSFVESDATNPEDIIVTVPVHMPDAIYREDESAVDLLERAKHIYQHWVKPGHRSGANTHNVSLTVTYRPEEQEAVADWMSENREYWAGISLLPYDGGRYIQSPFEEITEEEFVAWLDKVPAAVDFSAIDFRGQSDERLGELACTGGACEVR